VSFSPSSTFQFRLPGFWQLEADQAEPSHQRQIGIERTFGDDGLCYSRCREAWPQRRVTANGEVDHPVEPIQDPDRTVGCQIARSPVKPCWRWSGSSQEQAKTRRTSACSPNCPDFPAAVSK
jgi:hypothetical protein